MHQELRIMEEIAISKFKATCLAVLERVRKTGQPIRVTRFGQIIAEIQPPSSARSPRRFGRHIGSAVILGDIVGPIGDESDWEAARDPELDESKNEK
jgi:antitoxin (DNA-binding transcriptional repressor) of toxin-antitoxin stability system